MNCQMIAYLSSPLLLELGTYFPRSQPLVKYCQFGVSPVNYSDQIRHVSFFLYILHHPLAKIVCSCALQEELEKVQNCAARFVTRNYVYETGSMTGILGQLKWEPFKKRRKDNRLILLYKGLKGKARLPTDDLIPKTRRGRNQHSLAFQIPSANKDVYKYSFFPQTIRDWNNLPESLISSSELSDDSVSKFTSFMRARD